MKKEQIKREKSHAFGKDIYLVGTDEAGIKYWLEAPKWDCSWYWGFGYIETYTNNNSPETSRDIDSHQHWDGFTGQQEKYNHEKGCFVKADYIHNIYDNPKFTAFTFTEKQGWELSELFKQFYLLREMAEFCHKKHPGCNITTVINVNHGDLTGWYDKINKEMIPRITAEILHILSPSQEQEMQPEKE